MGLIKRSESVLLVMDVQDYFLNKLPSDLADQIVERVNWLIAVAHHLHIPVVTTAEDFYSLGGTSQRIKSVHPQVRDYNKMVFGIAEDPACYPAIELHGRNSVILTGLETDVCICHSALGLLGRGYNVTLIEDATGTSGHSSNKIHSIIRMRQAGVTITNTKGIYYEWTRTVVEASETLDSIDPKITIPEDLLI